MPSTHVIGQKYYAYTVSVSCKSTTKYLKSKRMHSFPLFVNPREYISLNRVRIWTWLLLFIRGGKPIFHSTACISRRRSKYRIQWGWISVHNISSIFNEYIRVAGKCNKYDRRARRSNVIILISSKGNFTDHGSDFKSPFTIF